MVHIASLKNYFFQLASSTVLRLLKKIQRIKIFHKIILIETVIVLFYTLILHFNILYRFDPYIINKYQKDHAKAFFQAIGKI